MTKNIRDFAKIAIVGTTKKKLLDEGKESVGGLEELIRKLIHELKMTRAMNLDDLLSNIRPIKNPLGPKPLINVPISVRHIGHLEIPNPVSGKIFLRGNVYEIVPLPPFTSCGLKNPGSSRKKKRIRKAKKVPRPRR